MYTMALLAKTLVDLSFGGAFVWYLVKFLVSACVAFGGIKLGIKLRKSKNEKNGTDVKETA